jgi:hypothetical protein
MARKVVMGVIVAVLVGAIALFAAEKAKEKKAVEKPQQGAMAVEQTSANTVESPKHKQGLLDQLISAYQANDREKMGEIIKKMENRREKMQEFAKFNRWHQEAHRKWAMAGCGANPGCGRGGAMTGGPGRMRGCSGFGQGQDWGPGPIWKHDAPPAWNMPRGDCPKSDVPPPEWGW